MLRKKYFGLSYIIWICIFWSYVQIQRFIISNIHIISSYKQFFFYSDTELLFLSPPGIYPCTPAVIYQDSIMDLVKGIAPNLVISSAFLRLIPLTLVLSTSILRHVYVCKAAALLAACVLAASLQIRAHVHAQNNMGKSIDQEENDAPDMLVLSSLEEAFQFLTKFCHLFSCKNYFSARLEWRKRLTNCRPLYARGLFPWWYWLR